MAKGYTSPYTGPEIDERLSKAGTSVQTIEVEGVEAEKDAEGNVHIALPVNAYTSIVKKEPYLYELGYDALDYEFAREYFEGYAPAISGGCSSIVVNGIAGRNYDWKYNHEASFIIHTAKAQGRYATFGVAEGMPALTESFVDSRAYSTEYKALPFRMHDGQNECGLYAEVNVVPSRENTATVPLVEKRDRVCASMLVRYILDNYASVDEAVSDLQNYVEIYMPSNMEEMGYELHFTLSDATETRVIEFIDNAIVVIDNNKSTNFHLHGVTLNADGSVYTNADVADGNLPSSLGIEDTGAGLERWNILNAANITDVASMRALLESIYYTKAYTNLENVWYSEFLGDDVTVDTPTGSASLIARVAIARAAYEERSRDTAYTWQTVHSSVYDLVNKVLYVTAQEGDTEYKAELIPSEGGVSKDYVDGEIERVESQVGEKVSFTPQTLTDEQKAQARENIGAISLLEITYSELKSLRDNGLLIPGQQYRITDYHTVTSQTNTQSADHQFDIIVVADSEGSLNENARACLHEDDVYFVDSNLSAWKLKYSLDNDSERFAWADSNGKGVIYYMKDEWNNECPYDFKNIMFKRWWDSSTSSWSNVSGSTGGVFAYTFSSAGTPSTTSFSDYSLDGDSNDIRNNIIGEYVTLEKSELNNIIFFGNSCHFNTFGNGCYRNTFGNGCFSNTFGNYCPSNTFGNSCSFNTFGNSCSSNTFGNGCYRNTFGNSCSSNTFGNSCSSNTFGNSCSSNTFGNYSAMSYYRNIALGDGVAYCKIYGTTTPTSSANLQNIRVAQGTQGTSSSKLAISVATNLAYETYVGLDSNGNLTYSVIGNLERDIDDIEGKIPSQASSTNQLADKAFVNSSIQTASANFRGNWATKSAIPTDYTLYPADYAGNKKPTTNDYLVIQADESEDGGTWRYKYTGDWDTDGVSGWNAEYEVNETPLTAAQLAALNSGITSTKVEEIAGKYVKPQTGIPANDLTSGVQTSLEKANSAVQPSALDAYRTSSEQDVIDAGKNQEIDIVILG